MIWYFELFFVIRVIICKKMLFECYVVGSNIEYFVYFIFLFYRNGLLGNIIIILYK